MQALVLWCHLLKCFLCVYECVCVLYSVICCVTWVWTVSYWLVSMCCHRYCGYIVDNGDGQFVCHGFMADPNTNKMCISLHSACQVSALPWLHVHSTMNLNSYFIGLKMYHKIFISRSWAQIHAGLKPKPSWAWIIFKIDSGVHINAVANVIHWNESISSAGSFDGYLVIFVFLVDFECFTEYKSPSSCDSSMNFKYCTI